MRSQGSAYDFSFPVLGNKKIKKPSRKSKTKKPKIDDDEDKKIVEPTSTQDAELEKLIQTLTLLHEQEKPSLLPPTDEDVKPTTTNLCDIVGKQLISAIDWARGLPGYETLTLNDQAILLQAGWIEMLLLNWIFYSLPHTSNTQFSSNFIVNEALAPVLGLETVHNQLTSLVSRVQGYGINGEEFVCLKAIGLLNAGKTSLFQIFNIILYSCVHKARSYPGVYILQKLARLCTYLYQQFSKNPS